MLLKIFTFKQLSKMIEPCEFILSKDHLVLHFNGLEDTIDVQNFYISDHMSKHDIEVKISDAKNNLVARSK